MVHGAGREGEEEPRMIEMLDVLLDKQIHCLSGDGDRLEECFFVCAAMERGALGCSRTLCRLCFE